MSDLRKIAMVGAPLVAMATVALGLRIGAGSAVRGAIVHGAPRARGSDALAWQLGTFVDDRGVREAVATRGLTVLAHAGGSEATWHGDTNADGVAEVRLVLPASAARIWVEVHADGESTPLAAGYATECSDARAAREPSNAPSPFTRPTKREGEIALDVAIYGERLAPGYPTPVWIRATERATGRPLAGVAIEAEPEPGLTIDSPHATTCANGFAQLEAVAIVHVVGLSIHARSNDGARSGDFFGGLPVAAGAYAVTLPANIPPGVPKTLDILAPNARSVVYAEVDDDEGRAYGATIALSQAPPEAMNAMPHAALTLPPLTPHLAAHRRW